MTDNSVLISDRTPLLEKKEIPDQMREKSLLELDSKYGICNPCNNDEDCITPASSSGDQELFMTVPENGPTTDIVCIFAVAFDARAGNIVEWHLPKDCDVDGIEFRAMASGSHKVQTDFIYFKRGGLYGLACFENMPVESTQERGARMKSLGVLASNYTTLHQHMTFLREQVRHLLECPGSYSAIESYFNENKGDQPMFDAFDNRQNEMTLALKEDNLFVPLMKITHPAGCFSQFVKFFGENIFALWKMVLLKKRIIFFSPPPIGVVCYRVYCTMCLATHRISELGIPTEQPLFYINIADVDVLETQKSYIACTTEKIFESKSNLYDLFVDNQNLTTEIPILQKMIHISPAMKTKYSQLLVLQSQMNEENGWNSIEDETWFVRYFMALNERLFTMLLSVAKTQDKLWTEDNMHAMGLDPVSDRSFIMDIADLYGIDIIGMVDGSCCPS